MRPFGVSLMVAGYDTFSKKPQLYWSFMELVVDGKFPIQIPSRSQWNVLRVESKCHRYFVKVISCFEAYYSKVVTTRT